MADNEILSEDEMSALLEGVEKGDVATEGGAPVAKGEVTPYDFQAGGNIVRGSIPTLDMINHRFSRYLRKGLNEQLRREPEISAHEARRGNGADFLRSLEVPSCLNLIHLQPLQGVAMVVFDAKLVFALVDAYFGGSGGDIENRQREFTAVEMRVTQMVLQQVLADLAQAWAPVLEIRPELVRTESNPRFTHAIGPNEPVIVSTIDIDLGGSRGRLQLVLPDSMVEPVREVLTGGVRSDRSEVDGRWEAAMREGLKEATVTLGGTLVETRLTLRQVMQLRAGDVIAAELPPTIVLHAEGEPAVEGTFGEFNGHVAVKVTRGLQQMRRP